MAQFITPDGLLVYEGDRFHFSHIQCAPRPSSNYVPGPTWQTDPLNPSVMWVLDLDAYKRARVSSLSAAARDANLAGFVSSALGLPHTYSTNNVFSDFDDPSKDSDTLTAAYVRAVHNKADVLWTVKYPCRASGESQFVARDHTASQMIQVGEDGFAFIQANRERLRSRLAAIRSATTKEQVDAAAVW